mmetsp:Transcript_8898/g.14701  ORF Transcript_8898/g.14701 Transcript_8898/m.14701 type:complete len:94 (+) Transcript_8898:194-475(+)
MLGKSVSSGAADGRCTYDPLPKAVLDHDPLASHFRCSKHPPSPPKLPETEDYCSYLILHVLVPDPRKRWAKHSGLADLQKSIGAANCQENSNI